MRKRHDRGDTEEKVQQLFDEVDLVAAITRIGTPILVRWLVRIVCRFRKGNSLTAKHRLSLSLSDDGKAKLDAIAQLDSGNASAAVRKALSLYKFMLDAEKQGAHLVVEYPDGTRVTPIIVD